LLKRYKVEDGEAVLWKRFKESLPLQKLKSFLASTYSTIELGVRLFSRMLFTINEKEARNGARLAGAIAMPGRLSPIQTLAIQDRAGITGTARISLNRSLSFYNGGQSIFANDKAMQLIQKVNDVKRNFGTYLEDEGVEGEGEGGLIVPITFMWKNPDDILKAHLQILRDNMGPLQIGIELGSFGRCIVMVFQGDHGGDHEQMLVINVAYEGARQQHSVVCGSYKGKENYTLLNNTIMPHMNAGIKKHNNMYVIILEWDEGFDFLLVPKEHCSLPPIDKSCWPPGTVTWFDGKVTWNNIPFERTDIPSQQSWKAQRTLDIVSVLSGDLAFVMMLQGRQNHAPSKCHECDSTDFKSAADDTGVAYTHERIAQEVRDYRAAHDPNSVLAPADLEALTKKSAKACAQSGIKGYDAMLPDLPIEQMVLPVLHIGLGIGNDLMKFIKDIITQAEVDTENMVDKNGQISEAMARRRKIEEDLQILTDCEEAVVKDLQFSITEFDSIAKSKAYATVKDLRTRGKNLTARLKTTANIFDEKVRLYGSYGPDMPDRISSKASIKAFGDDVALKKLLGVNVDKEIKGYRDALEKLKTTRRTRPLERQFDDILAAFGIYFQQHFTMTLTGKPIHRLLRNHDVIIDRIIAILPEEVQESRKEQLFLMKDAMGALDYLCSIMNDMNAVSEEEKECFYKVAKAFGTTYRRVLNKQATPKVHLLETHAAQGLRKYGRLGIFSEQPIESEHARTNLWFRKYKNIHGWSEKIIFIDKRRNAGSNPCVAKEIRDIESGTTRDLSMASRDRSKAITQTKQRIKTDYHTAIKAKPM
jgi:hypothetical protein